MSIYIQAPNTGPNLSGYATISQLNNSLSAMETKAQILASVTTDILNVEGQSSLSGTFNMEGSSSFAGNITLTGSQGINFTGTSAPARTLDLTALNPSSIYLDTYGNVKAQSTAPAGTNWHVTDNTNNNILSIYTDGTQKIKSFNNTLDDGSGNVSIIGNLSLPTQDVIVQATLPSTAVFSSHQIGTITLAAGSLGASGSTAFTLTNINIKTTSLIFLQSANFTQLNISTQSQTNSTVNIIISNISSVTQTWSAGQVSINFLIL
jgi:hypothetical protein